MVGEVVNSCQTCQDAKDDLLPWASSNCRNGPGDLDAMMMLLHHSFVLDLSYDLDDRFG
jgi:hypothetical protein